MVLTLKMLYINYTATNEEDEKDKGDIPKYELSTRTSELIQPWYTVVH